jgi:NitT/TauT family transport system substrate-binding protein
LLTGAGLILAGIFSPAAADTRIKMLLPYSFQGALSPWTLSYANGCYRRHGLDVSIDPGAGSADSLSKVAAGAYDIGVVDFTVLVAFNARQSEQRMVATFISVDRAPTSVVTLKRSGVGKPRDLAGKRIGDSVGEASREMFPAFAKANGLDPASVTWISVSPNLRHVGLRRGDYEAAAGHIFTITSGLRAIGVADSEVTVFPYAQWGVDQYGNAVVAKAAWLAQHRDAMTAFLACAVDGIKGSIADPKAAVATLKPFNSLLDEKQALLELEFSNSFSVLTPNVQANGLSAVDPARLNRILSQVSDALGFAKPPADQVWDARFLPPVAERKLAPN